MHSELCTGGRAAHCIYAHFRNSDLLCSSSRSPDIWGSQPTEITESVPVLECGALYRFTSALINSNNLGALTLHHVLSQLRPCCFQSFQTGSLVEKIQDGKLGSRREFLVGQMLPKIFVD
ncbi:hypothetical protein Mapa_008096 [Marchantia paleacea]|nr:hypothetical protein Mapa_008096 [Marchantia paleacea]